MRMAVLTNWYPPHIGGSAINIHKICREHSKRHEVTVLTPLRYESPREEIMEGVCVKRFPIAGNRPPRFPYRESKVLCPGIFWEVLYGRFDLISAYPSLCPNLRLCMLAGLLKRTPIVLTVFDLLDYRALRLRTFPDPDFLERFYEEKGSLRRLLFRQELARCRAIFGIAPAELNFIRRFQPRIYLTPVHVDLTEFDRVRPGTFRVLYALDGKKLVLSVGRIEPHKGQDILLRVIPGVIRRDPTAHFVFAGPVDDQDYYTSLRKMVEDLEISRAVLFTGPLDRTALVQAFLDCDLHVAPVRFMNSGAITQEAWAARKPAIQSNRAHPNHIEEGVDGYTFDIADLQALAEKILLLLADEALRRRLGENGRRKVEDHFDYQKGIRRLETLYIKALEGRNGADPPCE